MAEFELIASDAHVSEPPDLWVERLDAKYRDRAPRVVLNPEGQEGAYFVYEGYPPHNLLYHSLLHCRNGSLPR
jgi:hypothetical protein